MPPTTTRHHVRTLRAATDLCPSGFRFERRLIRSPEAKRPSVAAQTNPNRKAKTRQREEEKQTQDAGMKRRVVAAVPERHPLIF